MTPGDDMTPILIPMDPHQRWRVREGIGATLRGVLAGGALVVLAGGALAILGPAAAWGTTRPTQAYGAMRPAQARGATRTLRAHAAQAMKATDTAHLRYVSASGSLLFEEGRASGTLPGSMRVHFDLAATLSGSFTIYTPRGSISGRGEATPHGSGVYESFAGWLAVTGGTGRYRHARGRTGLYGTFDRDTYALTVQTTGTLSY
jgi:hypothetical protein